MNNLKSKLTDFLTKEENPTIDEFYEELYYKGIALCSELPFTPVNDPEADEAEKMQIEAIVDKYGQEECDRICTALLRRRVREEEQAYRWFFKQGVKIGHTVSEIVHEKEYK